MIGLLPSYIIAVDLGQVSDYTAIVVAQRTEEPTGRTEGAPGRNERPQHAGGYDLIHLERVPLGTPYTAIPPRLQVIADQARRTWVELAVQRTRTPVPFTAAPVALVVDQTGVGRPVVDLLREHHLAPVAVTITGGDQVLQPDYGEYRVPKRLLAGTVQTLLQTRRLRWIEALPEAATLKAELMNFKAKISLSGHDSYGAGADWREGNHDDLVLAAALACWYGEHTGSRGSVTHVSSYLDDSEAGEEPARW